MFKVWDKVRIKSRERMEKEFGLDYKWDIQTWSLSFLKDMKHLCWGTAIISEIYLNMQICLKHWNNNEETIWFGFTIDMIELVEPERTPTPWEYVEVGNDNKNWDKRIFITNLWGRYHCTTIHYESECRANKTYMIGQWKYIRPIQTKQTYTIEATEEQLWMITCKEYNNLSREKIQEIVNIPMEHLLIYGCILPRDTRLRTQKLLRP